MLLTLARTAVGVARRRAFGAKPVSAPPELPGPIIRATLLPRPPELIRDYVQHVGGDSSWYRGVVPAHLFPQWGMPLLARTLEGIPYDLTRVLNGGVSLEMNLALPAGEAMEVEARLVSIDDNGRRAVLRQECVTSTPSAPRALVATTVAIVPLERSSEKRERPRVEAEGAESIREIGRYRLSKRNGLDFAKLTGDFNPIHLFEPYARAAGQKSVILHGYATLARAIEALNRSVFAQDPSRLRAIDVRFARPLVLPANVGVFLSGSRLMVGEALGGPAYLSGSFVAR